MMFSTISSIFLKNFMLLTMMLKKSFKTQTNSTNDQTTKDKESTSGTVQTSNSSSRVAHVWEETRVEKRAKVADRAQVANRAQVCDW